MNEKGFIFNIQRFSLHDGPGIRTTVFFKGCPLRCMWCQNPEGISLNKTLFCNSNKCLDCRSCEKVCPEHAVSFSEFGPLINRDRCTLCLECVEACPVETLEAAGREISVPELVGDILKDRVIFEESGGGATFSGGEPLFQPEFLVALLKALKNLDIHTTVETSGYSPWTVLEETAAWTDLFLYDLKLVDEEKSKHYTGTTNTLILDNLKALAEKGSNIQVRMPLIPSINDDYVNLQQTAAVLIKAGIDELDLIPYHKLGTAKYANLGLDYKLPHIKEPSTDQCFQAKSILKRYGIAAKSEV